MGGIHNDEGHLLTHKGGFYTANGRLVADIMRTLAFDVCTVPMARATTYEWDRFPLQPSVVSLHPMKDKHV
jgi:hypothetical protein